jgi:hypothetical protein
LARQFYKVSQKSPGSQAVQDALGVLEGKALFEGPEASVYTRLAEYSGAIYLDLGDEEWHAIQITRDGWEVLTAPPVKFRRARGMLALPMPRAGGSLDDLQAFVNVAVDSEADWTMLVSWLLSALRPRGPYPILALHGEQGSAKSTTARVLRELIDPNSAPLQADPRDVHDLVIAAANSWVVCLDNLSHLQPWLSDAICRLSTGGGFATREPYSDADEVLFDAQRPIILNGIEELATRWDLLDRSIMLYLPTIRDRKAETMFWAEFEQKRPQLLGVLLDTLSGAMKRVDNVKRTELPRMADFALWATVAEQALGWKPDTFRKAYAENQAVANQVSLEASLLAAPLEMLVHHKAWNGNATALLAALEGYVEETTKRQRQAEKWEGIER